MERREWDTVVMSLELSLTRMTHITEQWKRWGSITDVLAVAESAAASDTEGMISPPGDPSVVDTSVSALGLGVALVRAWMKLVHVVVHAPLLAKGRRVFLPWLGAGGVAPIQKRITVFLNACKRINSRVMVLMKEAGATGPSKYQNARHMVLAILARHMLPCPIRARACGWTIPYANKQTLELWCGLALVRVGTMIGTPEGSNQCAKMLCYTPRVTMGESIHPTAEDMVAPTGVGTVRHLESKTGDFKITICVVSIRFARIAVSGNIDDVAWRPPRSDADMVDPARTTLGSLCVCILPTGDRIGAAPNIVAHALYQVSMSDAFHTLVVNTMLVGSGGTTRKAYTLSAVAILEMILDNAAMAAGLLVNSSSGDLAGEPTDSMRADVSCLIAVVATVAESHAWFAIRVQERTMAIFGVTRGTYVFVHGPTLVTLLSPPRSAKEPIVPLLTMPAYIGCIHA